jgi:misacylated tRNA(Ala) deacylase
MVWHTLSADVPSDLPLVGTVLRGEVDWSRRHQLMRTHTAMHILCGVIWNEWGVPVTGGNMEPLSARMDFEFDPLPEGFASRVEQLVNDAIAYDYPIEVFFLPRDTALQDADLIRTKVSLIPEQVREIRVVDIVGLDKQADGGTHVRSTKEVGNFRVVKTESKGKGNKRLRVEIR